MIIRKGTSAINFPNKRKVHLIEGGLQTHSMSVHHCIFTHIIISMKTNNFTTKIKFKILLLLCVIVSVVFPR